MFAFFEEEELTSETDKTQRLKNILGEVEFSHVKFGYSPEKTIIHARYLLMAFLLHGTSTTERGRDVLTQCGNSLALPAEPLTHGNDLRQVAMRPFV